MRKPITQEMIDDANKSMENLANGDDPVKAIYGRAGIRLAPHLRELMQGELDKLSSPPQANDIRTLIEGWAKVTALVASTLVANAKVRPKDLLEFATNFQNILALEIITSTVEIAIYKARALGMSDSLVIADIALPAMAILDDLAKNQEADISPDIKATVDKLLKDAREFRIQE